MEIKIQIEAPGLEKALLALSSSLDSSSIGLATQPQTEEKAEVQKSEPKKEEPAKEPETKSESDKPKISLDTVRAKLAALSQAGKQEDVKEMIQSFGAKKLTDIPEDKYPELLEKAEAI